MTQIRKEVMAFSLLMEAKLAKHDKERGQSWKTADPADLYRQIVSKVGALSHFQFDDNDSDRVTGIATDIGNLAMMLADVVGDFKAVLGRVLLDESVTTEPKAEEIETDHESHPYQRLFDVLLPHISLPRQPRPNAERRVQIILSVLTDFIDERIMHVNSVKPETPPVNTGHAYLVKAATDLVEYMHKHRRLNMTSPDGTRLINALRAGLDPAQSSTDVDSDHSALVKAATKIVDYAASGFVLLDVDSPLGGEMISALVSGLNSLQSK